MSVGVAPWIWSDVVHLAVLCYLDQPISVGLGGTGRWDLLSVEQAMYSSDPAHRHQVASLPSFLPANVHQGSVGVNL